MPRDELSRCYLGIGISSRAVYRDALTLAGRLLGDAGIAASALDGIATIDIRRDHPVIIELARHLGVGLSCYPAIELEALTPRLIHPSEATYLRIGCHGVAEASALAASGKGGCLLVGKTISGGVTMALARGAAVP